MTGPPDIRPAHGGDSARIAAIYNHGIVERKATFETRLREPVEIGDWLADSERHPVLVAERGGDVAGWARIGSYNPRPAYSGVGESQVYVDPDHRRGGVGVALTRAITAAAERRGYWKLIGRLFTDNEASLALVKRCGFYEVGVHRRHGRLDGAWRDVLVVERLLGDAAD